VYGILPGIFMDLFEYRNLTMGVVEYIPPYSTGLGDNVFPELLCLVYIDNSTMLNALTPRGTFDVSIISNTTAFDLQPFVIPLYCYALDTMVLGVGIRQGGYGVAIYYARESEFIEYYWYYNFRYIGVINIYNISRPWEFVVYEATHGIDLPLDHDRIPVYCIGGSRIIAPFGYESIGLAVAEISMSIPIPIPIPRQVPTATPTAPTSGIGMEWLLIAMAIIAIGGIAIASRR